MATDRTSNMVTSLVAKSNAGDNADVILWADPTTHRLLTSSTGGSGGGTSSVDDSAFTAATDSGTPIMGFATADSVDSGDVGVVAMTTARALHVYVKGSDVATGGTSMVDDAAFTPGTTSITPMGAMFDDVAPDSVNEGDGGVVRMSANRNLYVTLRDAAGNERGLNVDGSGNITVNVTGTVTVGSHAVTNAGTFAVQESGTQVQVDDAAFTPATSKVVMIGATFDNVATDSVDEGDGGAVRMSANRNLFVNIRDAAGNERGLNIDASGQLAVTLAAGQTLGTVTTVSTVTSLTQFNGNAISTGNGVSGTGVLRVTLASDSTGNIATIGTSVTPGTSAAHLGKAEDAVHNSGDTGVFSLGVANEAQTSLAADGDYIAQATDVKGNRMVVGNIAHDGVDAGAPVKIGAQAMTALPTAVAAADRVNMVADKFGRQVTLVGTIRDLVGTQTTTISASTTETTIVTAAGAGVFADLVMLIVSNTSASTTTRIDFRDATAGSVLFSLTSIGGQPPVGFNMGGIPIPQTTANNNWTAQCSASTTDIRIYAVYAKNK